MVVTKPRTRSLKGTTLAGPDLERTIWKNIRTFEWRYDRRKAADDLYVSRHTLWRFLKRGHVGRDVPSAVLNTVGGNIAALEAAALEIIIDLETKREAMSPKSRNIDTITFRSGHTAAAHHGSAVSHTTAGRSGFQHPLAPRPLLSGATATTNPG